MIEFTYESINNALHTHHPYLSGEWTSLGWDENVATVIYMIDATGEDVTVTVDRNGVVTAPDVLIAELDEMMTMEDLWRYRR